MERKERSEKKKRKKRKFKKYKLNEGKTSAKEKKVRSINSEKFR